MVHTYNTMVVEEIFYRSITSWTVASTCAITAEPFRGVRIRMSPLKATLYI